VVIFICLFVNKFYIPNRTSYKESHFVHNLFVYGLDEEKGKYFILGYDDTSHYQKSEISYDELEQGYVNNNIDRLFVTRVKDCQYKFDKEKIIVMLEDYLYSFNSRLHWNMYVDMEKSNYDINFYKIRRESNASFGIETYDKYIQYLEECIGTNSDNAYRIAYTIFEHNKLMKEGAKYFINEGIIFNQEKKITHLSENLEEYSKIIMN